MENKQDRNKKIKDALLKAGIPQEELKDVDAMAQEHDQILSLIMGFLAVLNNKYDALDILFAMSNAIDIGITGFEKEVDEKAGKDLRKTIIIGLESNDMNEASRRMQSEVFG